MRLLILLLWLISIRQPELNLIAFVSALIAFGVSYYFWSIYISVIGTVVVLGYYATAPTLSANIYTLIILGAYFVWATHSKETATHSNLEDDSDSVCDIYFESEE